MRMEIARREALEIAKEGQSGRKGKRSASTSNESRKTREEEIERALCEMKNEELGIYGSVF